MPIHIYCHAILCICSVVFFLFFSHTPGFNGSRALEMKQRKKSKETKDKAKQKKRSQLNILGIAPLYSDWLMTDRRLTDCWPVTLSQSQAVTCGEMSGYDWLCLPGQPLSRRLRWDVRCGLVWVRVQGSQGMHQKVFNWRSRAQREKGWQRRWATVNNKQGLFAYRSKKCSELDRHSILYTCNCKWIEH